MPTDMPSHVDVEVKNPKTGEVIWSQKGVPIAILMQVAGAMQQTKGMMGQVNQVTTDVKKALDGLSGLGKLFGVGTKKR